jgi:hypothetical protein
VSIEDDLARWMQIALPGDTFIYHVDKAKSQSISRPPIFRRIRGLMEAGMVRTHQRRDPETKDLQHIAVRRGKK